MRVEELGFSEWGEALPEKGFDVFHTPEALRTVNRHTTGELRLFGAFKGAEPVGLLPLHDRSKFGGRIVTSPPLGFGIGRLGPIYMPLSPKQQKRDSSNKEFIQDVLETADVRGPRTLLRITCSPRYSDPRPFQWNGFDVTPAFTYQLGLADKSAEQLLKSFSRDLRKDIRKRDDTEISVRTGGMADAKRTYQSVTERYKEQGLRDPLSWEFVRDLLDNLGEDRSRVYVAESADGDYMSGMIILYSDDTAYFWKGGAKNRRTSVSPNSLLHWQVIEDILTDPSLDSIDQYDLYTANNERLIDYKGRFGGTLSQYYTIESNGIGMTVAKNLYRWSSYGKFSSRGK